MLNPDEFEYFRAPNNGFDEKNPIHHTLQNVLAWPANSISR